MSIYAIIIIVLSAMSGGITLVKNGQDKGKYNFGVWLISAIITFTLLYLGGFFK